MKGTKKLELSEESMLEVVNEYISQRMPRLGVATSVGYTRNPELFVIHLAERQVAPPDTFGPGAPSSPSEPTLRVMRQEGVK